MLTVRHNLRGFTLVELVVGIAILGILFALAAPNFRTWIQNRQLSTAAESISTGLQLARAEAVRRNTNVSFTLAGPTSGDWTVGCVTPVGDLDVDGVDDCPANIQAHQTSKEAPHAEIAASEASVIFSGLGRATIVAAPLTIALTNTTGGTCKAAGGPMRCLNVVVAAGGQVRMCNPYFPHSNPQGC